MGRQLVYTFAADVLGCSSLVDALEGLQIASSGVGLRYEL